GASVASDEWGDFRRGEQRPDGGQLLQCSSATVRISHGIILACRAIVSISGHLPERLALRRGLAFPDLAAFFAGAGGVFSAAFSGACLGALWGGGGGASAGAASGAKRAASSRRTTSGT